MCLHRHHQSPINFAIDLNGNQTQHEAAWQVPTQLALNSWRNVDDATRDGAYCISLVAVELRAGLVAIGRAETRTGADYYVAPIGSDPNDFERSLRLEVSGVDSGNMSAVRSRLRKKTKQAHDGDSNLPAIASVVGFKQTTVAMVNVSIE